MSINFFRKRDRTKFTLLGAVTGVIAQHPHYACNSIEWIKAWIFNAVEHRQVYIHFRHGLPAGFITWASVREDTLARLIFSDYVLHWSEWTEGTFVWLLDFCLPETLPQPQLIVLLCSVFADRQVIYWRSSLPGSETIYRLHIAQRRLSTIDATRFVEILGKPERIEGAQGND